MWGSAGALRPQAPQAGAPAIQPAARVAAAATTVPAPATPPPPPRPSDPLAANSSSPVLERCRERGSGADECPKKEKKSKKEKREKHRREKGTSRDMPAHGIGRGGRACRAETTPWGSSKGGGGGPRIWLLGVRGGHQAAPRTWVHEVVPCSALAKALAVPWLPAALGKEPPTLDAPLFRGPMNAHVTLQFVLHRTLQGVIQHSKPLGTWVWVGTQEGLGWQWTVGNRAAAPPALLGSSEVLERKHIKTSGGLLGSVVDEVMHHR